MHKRGTRRIKLSRKREHDNISINEYEYMKHHIFEMRMKDLIKERSSQLVRNLKPWSNGT